MNTRLYFQVTALAALAAASLMMSPTAGAEPIMPARTGIDANTNTFIVGHPASPRWRVVHAGGEHPAVLQARTGQAGIDANTFTVQPPASVTWLASGEAPRAPVLAAAASLPVAAQR